MSSELMIAFFDSNCEFWIHGYSNMAYANKMSLNINKTSYMIVIPRNKILDSSDEIRVNECKTE